jgi:hypothetical protein
MSRRFARFRPVATPLLSAAEQLSLKAVTKTLAAYNVTFRQVKNADGYDYVLEPPLNTVVDFGSFTEFVENPGCVTSLCSCL